MAFTVQQVSRLTGLSIRQVRYWNRQGFFVPRYLTPGRRVFSSIYSFRDMVGLRTLAILRNQYKVPLQELRKVGAWLSERYETPWASLTFYIAGRRVYFDDPETCARIAGRPLGQTVIPIEMQKIERETAEQINRLRNRTPDQIGRIEQNRYVVQNAPVVAGTRIPTSAVFNFYEAGYSTEDIIREYPRLTPEDVAAAIEYEKQRRQKVAS